MINRPKEPTEDDLKKLREQKVDAHYKNEKEKRTKSKLHRTIRGGSRFFLDSSDAGVDVGSRTTRAITRTDANLGVDPSKGLAVAGDVFGYAGFAINIIYMLAIPFYYLYYKYQGEPIPFTLSNNVRWGVATAAVILTIVALAFPPAALGVGFAAGVVILAASIVGFVKSLQSYFSSSSTIVAVEKQIFELSEQMAEKDKAYTVIQNAFNALSSEEQKNQYPKYSDEMNKISKEYSQLAFKQKEVRHGFRELQVTYGYRLTGKQVDQKSQYQDLGGGFAKSGILISSIKLIVAVLLLVGLALTLNPVTWPIGVGMLVAGTILGISMYVTSKSQDYVINRQQKELKAPQIKIEEEMVKNKLQNVPGPIPVKGDAVVAVAKEEVPVEHPVTPKPDSPPTLKSH